MSDSPHAAQSGDDNSPWYRDGLRFECTQCGNCCTGAPGFVWVTDDEIQAIADYTGEAVGAVRLQRTRKARGQVTLIDYPNGDCTYFDPKTRGCTIYPVRPRQCRTWPFWNSNIESPAAWEQARQDCPGCGRGQLIPLEEIQIRAAVIDL